jgi:hypothetical protein
MSGVDPANCSAVVIATAAERMWHVHALRSRIVACADAKTHRQLLLVGQATFALAVRHIYHTMHGFTTTMTRLKGVTSQVSISALHMMLGIDQTSELRSVSIHR